MWPAGRAGGRSVSTSVGLGENRHHPRRSPGDHAAGVWRELFVEGDAADGAAELAHRLLGLRLLAPRRLDESPGIGLVAGEELAEPLERGAVVPGALSQALARLLEQAELNVLEDSDDRLRRAV